MANIIEIANSAYEERDRAQEKIDNVNSISRERKNWVWKRNAISKQSNWERQANERFNEA